MKQKVTAIIFGAITLFICSYRLLPVKAGERELVYYTVSFVAEEDRNLKIFNTQEGAEMEGTTVSAAFPMKIIGGDGHIWTSDLESPQSFKLYGSGTQKFYIEYRRGEKILKPEESETEEEGYLEKWLQKVWIADCAITGQETEGIRVPGLIVTNDLQNNIRIKNLVSMLSDAQWHYFYMLGKNYTPKTLVIGTNFEAEYSSVPEDEFMVGGEHYQVLKVGVKRKWIPETCAHDWQSVSAVSGGCMEYRVGNYQCKKCEKKDKVMYPAAGHTDLTGDSLCDRCGRRAFDQNIGDTIKTTVRTGEKVSEVTFTCLDDNYRGSGMMLYLSDEVLGTEVTGVCFEEDNNYNLSPIRQYFNREFPNNSSVGMALQPIVRADGEGLTDYAAFLSEEEYRSYRAAGILKEAETGYFLRTAAWPNEVGTEILAVAGDGEIQRVQAVGNTSVGARPFILLEKPETGQQAEPHSWKVGDAQMLKLGKQTYRFTCIDEDYSDVQEGHRKAALFLCDSVIRSDIDSDSLSFQAFSFGTDNNYKTSHVREWLNVNSSETNFNLEPLYIGVNTAYTGSTKEGTFMQLSENTLERRLIGFQLLNDRLFCLSLEEALKYRNSLWKFSSSPEDNPESQYSPYSAGYYLRTPHYSESELGMFQYSADIYGVDLLKGNIHTVGTDNNRYGLRPAFAVPQG